MTEFGYSFETFVCPEKDFFSGSRDEILPCFVETLQFVFEAQYDGCSSVSPLYQIRIGRAPPDRHATSPTVIQSFMTATLCLSPNFSPSGSGYIVSFSRIVDPLDNDSLE